MQEVGDSNTPNSVKEDHKPRWVWQNILKMLLLHIMSIYALSLLHLAYKRTLITGLITGVLAELGVTAGAHRLWSHRSYKAKLPLRTFLMLCHSMSMQNSILDWCRDHRVHHKYTETDADPHNFNRGFFFSHVGWLLQRKHPDVIRKGRKIQLQDLRADPVVMIQHRYYIFWALSFCVILPTLVPWYFWNESIYIAFYVALLRYCVTLNFTWCVNSIAHMMGSRPYDKNINPAENMLVVYIALGEGYHNYHHVFPHDYATSEHGTNCNITTAFIDIMAMIGQAYGRRTISDEVILKRKKRTGYNT